MPGPSAGELIVLVDNLRERIIALEETAFPLDGCLAGGCRSVTSASPARPLHHLAGRPVLLDAPGFVGPRCAASAHGRLMRYPPSTGGDDRSAAGTGDWLADRRC